jgi:hypothetical protein
MSQCTPSTTIIKKKEKQIKDERKGQHITNKSKSKVTVTVFIQRSRMEVLEGERALECQERSHGRGTGDR